MHRQLAVPMMIRILLTALALLPLVALPQGNPVLVNAPSFVDLGANTVQLPGERAAWDGWLEKLDRLVFEGTGKINVVHVGGSHIQADMWSMQLRHRLQHMVPGVRGSRGFIFPYTMAKSNNPYWYNPQFTGSWTALKNTKKDETGTLGLAGYSVTTHDTLTTITISFRGDVYPGYSFDRVRVLHRQDSSFAVDVSVRDSSWQVAKFNDPVRGTTEFILPQQVDTLRLRVRREHADQLRFTLYGIILENSDPGFVYHATGVNGASTTSWLRCERFAEELGLLEPDLVVFSIGINDAHDSDFSPARYKANYEQLIARVRSVAPDAAILLTTNTDSFVGRKTPNKNAAAVRKVMYELGAEKGVAVWDTWGVMGGEGSIRTWESAGLAQKDRVHFNRAGYALLGDLLFSALVQDHGAHVQRRYRP
jgi:lysophospholipase L1-like esterase